MATLDKDPQALLNEGLRAMQRRNEVRLFLGCLLLVALLGLGFYFVQGLIPHTYAVKLSGGPVLLSRHHLAKVLAQEAAKVHVKMEIVPTRGSIESLAMVSSGELDMAFVQGDAEAPLPNVVHVATLPPETLHIIVKPGINTIDDLRGKVICTGAKEDAVGTLLEKVLDFSGLHQGVDYVLTHESSEQIVSRPADRLPDAVVTLAYPPAYLADFLTREQNFNLIEVPFPPALALRYGWVADDKILAYTYRVWPTPSPPKDIDSVGVNLRLVANVKTDPRAIFQVLTALYTPNVQSRTHLVFDESKIDALAFYPISGGTRDYITRNDPLLSKDNLGKVQNGFGVMMTTMSTLFLILRWFRGPPPEPDKTADEEIKKALVRIADLTHEMAVAEAALAGIVLPPLANAPPDAASTPAAEPTTDLVVRWQAEILDMKEKSLRFFTTLPMKDQTLMEKLLVCLADARATVESLRARIKP